MLGDTFGFPLQHESSFCLPLSLDIVRRLQQEKHGQTSAEAERWVGRSKTDTVVTSLRLSVFTGTHKQSVGPVKGKVMFPFKM